GYPSYLHIQREGDRNRRDAPGRRPTLESHSVRSRSDEADALAANIFLHIESPRNAERCRCIPNAELPACIPEWHRGLLPPSHQSQSISSMHLLLPDLSSPMASRCQMDKAPVSSGQLARAF